MLNAFVVSKSKRVAVAVLVLDFLKGTVPLYLMFFVFKIDYSTAAYATVFLILGHNYPVWLKFKGGRGLAAGAGVFAVLNVYVLAMWCLVFVLAKLLKQDVLIANTAATLSILLSVLLVNKFDFFIVDYSIKSFSMFAFTAASLLVCAVVLSKHIEVFKRLFNNKTK